MKCCPFTFCLSQSQGLRREREFCSLNLKFRDENKILLSISQGSRRDRDIFFQVSCFEMGLRDEIKLILTRIFEIEKSRYALHHQFIIRSCRFCRAKFCGANNRTELHNVIFVTRMKIWVQNFTPKTRKSRLFVFTTKHVNPLLFGLTAEVSGVKLSQLNGFLNKDLHSVKNAYVSPKKFTPDLQIFYTFPVFGLNVCSCWG